MRRPPAQPVEGHLDAIVVGAGIAGLVAATDLAHRGHRVLVLEHNHQAGGLMSGMRRRGFYFDVGCQSFENMGIVFPLLEQYGLADLAKFRRAHYRVVMPGLDAVVESIPQMRRAFQRAYPGSSEGLGRVFDLHGRTSRFIQRVFQPDRVPYVHDERPVSMGRWLAHAVGGPALAWPPAALQQLRDLRTWMFDDFTDWYERELPPSGARDLLSRCGYTRMNVFVASAFWHLWAHDYWYPEGGLQAWLDRWVRRLEERGVRFLFKRRVTALQQRGSRVAAVVTAKGEQFEAAQVVYAGDYRQAVHRLVGLERFDRAEIARLERAHHSDAMVSAYLGLDVPAEELRERLGTSHTFYFPGFDCRTSMDPADPEAHRKAFLEVTAHAAADSGLAPAGKSAVVLQAFTRHDWLKSWKTGLSGDTGRDERSVPRPVEYRRLKRRVLAEMVGVFEGLLPGIGSRVVFAELGTPQSAVRFTRNAFGGTCGFELNWRNFPFRNPLAHVRSPLDNLHMAGHFTVWPGTVPTAALSGKIAALRAHSRIRARRSRAA